MTRHNGAMRTQLALALATIAVLAAPALAQVGTDFSLAPDPEVTASRQTGYFDYVVPAGTTIDDAVRIANTTTTDVDVVLYPSDAATSENGGISFPTTIDGTPSEAGTWITLSEREVTLAPGEIRSIPFTVAVPAGVTGQHAAGIVAQPPSGAAAGEGQFTVTVVPRTALTVLVTIGEDPETIEPRLEITGLRTEIAGTQQLVVIDLANTGDVGFRSSGTLTLSHPDGEIAAQAGFSLGYFLAGDTIPYRIALVPAVDPGDYDARVVVTYEEKTAEFTRRVQVDAPEEEGIVIRPGDEIVIETGGGLAWWVVALIVIGVAALVALVVLQALRIRRLGGGTPSED